MLLLSTELSNFEVNICESIIRSEQAREEIGGSVCSLAENEQY